MKIIIHGKPFAETAKPYIQDLFEELSARKINVLITPDFDKTLRYSGVAFENHQILEDHRALEGAKLVVSLGEMARSWKQSPWWGPSKYR